MAAPVQSDEVQANKPDSQSSEFRVKKVRMKLSHISTAADVQRALREVASPKRAASSAWFFKCGKGEYGEGDQFIGVTVPQQRAVARKSTALPLSQIDRLLRSKIHEDRLTGLFILVHQFMRARDEVERKKIHGFYLGRLRHVNNWDLVDSSAPYVICAVPAGNLALLTKLSGSKNLWERRVAMVATWHCIRQGSAREALHIAERLIDDEHDLIHKASGWMLREVGARVGRAHLRGFLKSHAATMPRTMLRYAVEHLSKPERAKWMRAAATARFRGASA
jgi:3-methyladenine DNA glycosylase AlkD